MEDKTKTIINYYTTFSSNLVRGPGGNCWYYTEKSLNNFDYSHDETLNKFDPIFRSNPPRMWFYINKRRKNVKLSKLLI